MGRFLVVGVGALALVGVVLMSAPLPLAPVRPAISRAAEIDQGCQREFASEGVDRVKACVRDLDARALIQIEQEKRAAAAAG